MAKDNNVVFDIDIIDTINSALKEENYELITTEIAPEIYSFPFLTEEFCNELIIASNSTRELFDNINKNNMDISKHVDYSTDHSDYKTDDIRLKNFNDEDDIDIDNSTKRNIYFNEYGKILREYALPLINYVWMFMDDEEIKDEANFSHETFLVKYTIDGQLCLDMHVDTSDFSIITKLNDDFEGSGTWFSKQKYLANKQLKVGDAIFFPALTHRHGARSLESGCRYILNSFCKIHYRNYSEYYWPDDLKRIKG